MVNCKNTNLLKKIACAALSVGIAFSYMPLVSYAASEPYKEGGSYASADSMKAVPVRQIEPGQKFTTGIYEIDNDIVVKSKPTQNGIEVEKNSKVKFILKNNHTVKIVAGDAKGINGGGAGVYVPEGSTFIVEGHGTFDVKGGDSAAGERGHKGGDADFREISWGYNKIKNGDGGAGGNGGGGAGAAVGSPGANGGLGAKTTKGREHRVAFLNNVDCDGTNGTVGAAGESPLPPGNFVLMGDVKYVAKGGKANKKLPKGGAYGKDLVYIDCSWNTCWREIRHTCTGGAGGGAGGNGYAAAEVGSGGSGGSGGGSGGTGTFNSALTLSHVARGNGGGGGAGQGSTVNDKGGGRVEHNESELEVPAENGYGSGVLQPGKGGKGGGTRLAIHDAGRGGNGGTVKPAGEGGKFYCDRTIELAKNKSTNENEFSGKASEKVKIVRACDCEVKIKNAPKDDVFVYTGEPIKPKIEVYNAKTGEVIPNVAYEIKYFDVLDPGEASIAVHGLEHGKTDIPIIINEDDFEIYGDVTKHFTIKYGVKISDMKVKSKIYDGKPVEPIGEAKFTRVDDPSIVVGDKLPIVVKYYDEEGNLLEKAPSKIGDYQYEIIIKSDVEKYTGSTGKLDFGILPGKNRHK